MFKRITVVFWASLSLVAVAPAVGCSSDEATPSDNGNGNDGGNGDGGDQNTSETVTKRISAAEGGTISDASGTVTLTIPAGALAQDTDISLAKGAAEAGSASSVYEFGPTGTQFSKPAVLTVKLDGAVPEGKTAQLAVLEGGAWKALEANAFADGTATGNVAHFSKFAIIFVDGKVVASACADEVASWAACGGDPTGTWKYSKLCATTEIGSGENPLAQACPDSKFEIDVTIDGTITFDGTNATNSAHTTTSKTTFIIPTSCYAALGNTTCDGLKQAFEADSCSEANGACTCSKSQSENEDADPPQPYTIEGTKITVGDGKPSAFCVNGSTLSVEALDDETGAREAIMFLEKQ